MAHNRTSKRGLTYYTAQCIDLGSQFIFAASPQVQSTSLLAFLPSPISNAISPAPTACTPLESLSLPWLSALSTAFTQPYFGANYLAMDVKPAPDGGLAFGTRVEVRFSDHGMFEFVRQLEGVRAKAIERAREAKMGEPLRKYKVIGSFDAY